MIQNQSIKRFIWGFSLLLAVFVNFPFIVLNIPHLSNDTGPRHNNGGHPGHSPHAGGPVIASWDIFIQISICLFFSTILIFYLLNSNKKTNPKRISIVFLMFSCFAATLSLLNYYFIGIHGLGMIITVIIRGILIIGLAYIFYKFLMENEQRNLVLLENEQLKHENLSIQLASLKNQLNPHFLFNSLNTLSWLINENKDKSQLFLQKLSQVLRYSLSMQEHSLVPLFVELTLVDNYIFLLQMRFGNSLIIFKKINNYENFKISPLSLQLLIENAIKHNIISTVTPMHIDIELMERNQCIKISNSINKKLNSESTGIGLANLNERFRILANHEIEINTNDDVFSVTLPLIQ